MATFEKDTWLWTPDPDECFLPGKVDAPFQQGSAGKVTFENGKVGDCTLFANCYTLLIELLADEGTDCG
jgi:hypothetical protein